MATDNTLAFPVTDSEWTLIADGATVASVAVQIDPNSTPACIAVKTALPAVSSDDYVILDREHTKEFTADLSATAKVYAKAPAYSRQKSARCLKVANGYLVAAQFAVWRRNDPRS